MFDEKQKSCEKRIHLVPDDGYTAEELFIK